MRSRHIVGHRTMRDVRLIARVVSGLIGIVLFAQFMVPSPASAAPTPDADRFEIFFPAGDGLTMLHADVLRPKGLGRDVRTPVVMTVGPYFNPNDFVSATETGPQRFYDFLDLTDILQKGYSYVMVDLPGFGGSGGCNDWGGFREQGAVVAAVEWAASQRWSTGRVALMGKSYDAWTGLMAIARQPRGLAAVVAMEPVFSGYRYLYANGVRFGNSFTTGLIFQGLDMQPGEVGTSPQYQINGAPQAWCYGVNVAAQQQDEPNVPFWMERDLLPSAIGKRTPLFLTQGFLERNTRPDAAFDFFNGLAGPKRAWFGQFDHVRGWQKSGKRYLTGRSSFVEEVMRFIDHHTKGVRVRPDPRVVVQDNIGRYRAERSWPPSDSRTLWSRLNVGTYPDDGANQGTGPNGGKGLWSLSQRLPHDVWLAGEPRLDVSVDAPVPRTNVVGNVYDVDADGDATLISRGTSLVRDAGLHETSFELYGQDWLLRKGHRIGVLVSGANSEWWAHFPTRTTVSVRAARIGLPFLSDRRTKFGEGRASERLKEHLASDFVVDRPTMKKQSRAFRLPPPLD